MGIIDSRVVNIDELKLEHFEKVDRFESRGTRMGPLVGAISTMMPAEICEYPDSKRVGVFAKGVRHMTHADANVDYWTGEV